MVGRKPMRRGAKESVCKQTLGYRMLHQAVQYSLFLFDFNILLTNRVTRLAF